MIATHHRSHTITAIVTQNGNGYEEGFVPAFWDPISELDTIAGSIRGFLGRTIATA